MKSANVNTRTMAKTRKQTRVSAHAGTHEEVSRNTVAAMSAAPVLIGVWAAACFVGAIVSTGGPLALARTWFQAVTGM